MGFAIKENLIISIPNGATQEFLESLDEVLMNHFQLDASAHQIDDVILNLDIVSSVCMTFSIESFVDEVHALDSSIDYVLSIDVDTAYSRYGYAISNKSNKIGAQLKLKEFLNGAKKNIELSLSDADDILTEIRGR